MLALTVAAFAVAWWLGLYLLGRNPAGAVTRRCGVGLLAYAGALALAPFDTDASDAAGYVLAGLPAVIWTGVLVAYLPLDDSHRAAADRVWSWAVLPLATAGLVAAAALGGGWRSVTAVLVLVPLAFALGAVVRVRRGAGLLDGVLILVTLVFGLGAAVLFLPLGWLPAGLVLAAVGADLIVLGVVVAASDAVESGETLAPDLGRSAVSAAVVTVVFAGQVGLVGLGTDHTGALRPLVFGVVGAAIAVVTLAGPWQSAVDRVVFARAPGMRAERAELREAADSLARRDAHRHVDELDDDEFAGLVRQALRHYGDLGKLVASPLTDLPALDKRLAGTDRAEHALERATELKALLRECIDRLKPAGPEFGTTDEWRHYNALYFPYVAGIRPYRRQPDLSVLDDTSRRAFDWFRRYVPERTLYNWQRAATRVVAMDLRNRDS